MVKVVELESLVDTIKYLKESNCLTRYQHKGMLLEIATYYALVDLGIRPVPLHNPFDDDYARDQHLGIDMIFRHKSLTFGVECKNLNRRWDWSQEDFVDKQLLKRFNYVEKVVPIDVKVLVTSYVPLGGSAIPKDIYQLILNTECTTTNIYTVKHVLENLFLSLFHQIEQNNTVNTTHGGSSLYENILMLKREESRIKLIDRRLKKQFEIRGWIEDE